ncbi:MAG: tetraacyldisaccharide 4'-kinase [Acidobacteria bacterium]|nr:tetraacyldisaccharide 4'-kinase [Acidobacteriota bacterium]
MNARRPWGRFLVPVTRGVVGMKDALRARGLLRSHALRWPVISVGSLSAGGAGKTPVVIALAKMLRAQGWEVDVLSRGYRRDGRDVARVDRSVDGAAARFGDEPVLIAACTGAPVWVGANRLAAGRLAEADVSDAQRGVHLLDDGFQHRRLRRAVDIVLMTEEDLDDALLPAGNLREGFSALARADVVVVREDELESAGKRVWRLLRDGTQMWTVRRSLRFPAPLFVFGAGLRPVAFCAIARPEGFAAMLQNAGCGVVETVAFRDHHRYTMTDVERVVEIAKGLNGSGFVTTEKDAVKLTAAMRARLAQHGPLMVVALEAVFADTDAVMRSLAAMLQVGEQTR